MTLLLEIHHQYQCLPHAHDKPSKTIALHLLATFIPMSNTSHSKQEPKLQHGVGQKSRSKSYGSRTPLPSKKQQVHDYVDYAPPNA
jgi:hypothetical protein